LKLEGLFSNVVLLKGTDEEAWESTVQQET